MPVNSSGRIVKTKKTKGGTAHQKNHRWESFTSKISKLSSLDPLRRVRRNDLENEDISTSTSYLKNGLEKWVELNMSEVFLNFSREVTPMCDSLPQIIHFEDKIMDSFVLYFEKQERESLEPLLELITDFAHDLGHRFEKYYAKVLKIVTTIAETSHDVAVIEWSFTSLAFMFKYLSKLLVPDLRPTYDLMAPLLGKQRQRPHIARFAAEALSFLIKKSGTPAHREKALILILNHAKDDLSKTASKKEFTLYYHGLMTMIAEAIKGHGLGIHTSGQSIFRSMFHILNQQDLGSEQASPWMNVICGVLTSLLHHTDGKNFEVIMEVVIESAIEARKSFNTTNSVYDLRRMLFSARMIGICSGVRKGTRILNWVEPVKLLVDIFHSVSKHAKIIIESNSNFDLWSSLVLSLAIVMQYVPIDVIIGYISPLMDALTKDPLANCFLVFCSYLSELESERFRSIALPYFQRFMVAHWSDAENCDSLSVLLPKMSASGVLPHFSSKDGMPLPQSWQDQIVSKFERLEISPFPEQASPAVRDRSPTTWRDQCLPKYNALLEVLECTVVHPSTNARIAEILLRKLKLALRPSSSLASEEANFIVGRGFIAYLKMTEKAGEVDSSLGPLLRAAAPRYIRLTNFLSALHDYERRMKELRKKESITQASEKNSDQDKKLIASLICNLSTDSHNLRFLSLRLLDQMNYEENSQDLESLSIMTTIEQTSLDLQNARSISMRIRKLATLYPNLTSGSWLRDAIPAYCFGMLTVKFTQIWEDAISSLKVIAQTNTGEGVVSKLAISWLEISSINRDGPVASLDSHSNQGLTDFECSNLINILQSAIEAKSSVTSAREIMLKRFSEAQESVSSHPLNARSQSLRVLAATPFIAEKHSRQLVPMFLSWARSQSEVSDDTEISGEIGQSNWNRKDQKAQLELFTHFLNPKSLYKSEDVHAALLNLLKNGDLEIQKSALKAIFTWKDPSLKPYEESLLNLLDDARFKEELGLIFQSNNSIQDDHRPIFTPVLLRILYGRSISQKGAASGRQGMEARRRAIFRALSTEDVGIFLDISLGDLINLRLIQNDKVQEETLNMDHLNARKQLGLVHMIESILKELGTQATPFTDKIASSLLYCIIHSSRRLQDDQELDDPNEGNPAQTLLKLIRQSGIKSLVLLFSCSPEFKWSPYMSTIDKEVLSPRLNKLPIETAQGISGILKLISALSSHKRLAPFLGINDQILIKVAECLTIEKSKVEVKIYALSIIKNLVKLAREDPENNGCDSIKEKLLSPNMDNFLIRIASVLRSHQNLSKELLQACVETVSELAPFVTTSTQGRNLVDVSTFLLDQPSRRVNPKTKGELLLVLQHFVPLFNLQDDPCLREKVYNTITSLFGFFKDKASREVLSRVLMVFSEKEPVLGEVASVCKDLNSYLENRLDEPDYDLRLSAFNTINSQWSMTLSARQWVPLLYNLMYYIGCAEEFGIISSNSSDGICQFITVAGSKTEELEKVAFVELLKDVLLPALFSGARNSSEIIRREYLKVMAQLVRVFSTWPEVSDMHGLLAGEDELEESFFNNLISAGKGRQSGALVRLSVAAERGELSSKNVSHFFVPMIEHFIFDRAEGNDGHNLAAEATTTLSVLSASLEWPQYRAMLRRFIGYIEQKPELEKQIIKLLGKIIDTLADAANLSGKKETHFDLSQEKICKLSTTLPKQEKFAEELISQFLPPLMKYLHDKDDSTVSLRTPVAIIIVRLLKLLPQEQLNDKLPAVLTDVCHILKSKAQEARDMTRDTLSKICSLLGPSCFGFILKELRGALARGYQLHVLSYTMHSLLVAITSDYTPGDLDYCLPSIVAIIMDDIFGVTGQEKDAEDYVSRMKEVKSSKSHDSMELIAKTVSITRLITLVRPIQALLMENLNIRMVRKIDELLNRISNGLLKNSAAASRDSLVFCYEVIQDVYSSEKPRQEKKEDFRHKKYLLQKGVKKSGERGSTTIHTYKLARFAFDVLRSILRKNDDLRTPVNLIGFIPVLGDAVMRAEEEVKVAVFKLLMTIAKVPLKDNDGTNLYRVAASEALKAISASSSITSDMSQVALKFLSIVLRDRRDVPIKETAIDTLLTRMKDDITQPEFRHLTFHFLRAVLDSKIHTAAVYDTLDYVGNVMVTNEDKDTRDLARGAYFHFLREYPQKQSRWSKQLAFIIANLKYDREGGRLSILEVIHLLLSKSAQDFVQEVSATTFVPLVFVLANDESEKCRMLAGELLKTIFSKADSGRMNTFLSLLRSWIKNNENMTVTRLAFQTFGFYFESQNSNDSDLPLLFEAISEALQNANDKESDWEQIYFALQLTSTLISKFPNAVLDKDRKDLWSFVHDSLSFPHAWVKLSAAKLIGNFFADIARSNQETKLEGLPLKGSCGLKLEAKDVTELARKLVQMYKTPGLTQLLADEIVKNLVFLAKVAGVNDLKLTKSRFIHTEDEEDAEEEEEEEEKDGGERKTVLKFLFGRLSYILRQETSPPRFLALIPKISSLQLISYLTSALGVESLAPHLSSILLPLSNIVDPNIPSPYSTEEEFRTAYEGLKTTSEEIMENLKKKLGNKVYSETLVEVRQGVKERRSARSIKRKIEAVVMPEKYGEHKRKKGERKERRRKEKGAEHARRRHEF
ncbi:U3 small nucleolar RNA-associated protein 20 [Podosphaera aphanis]|nr:U3 small nucleolar RNA-associated protein 20 [Podosphaera aphanis]